MTDQDIKQQLLNYHIRPTEIRKALLALFYRIDHALSHTEIADHLEAQWDRVTLYRSLERFYQQGLIHRIIDPGGVARYARCLTNYCHAAHHIHDHIHFCCQRCGRVFCVRPSQMPEIDLGTRYRIDDVDIMVSGICPDCKSAVNVFNEKQTEE